MYADNVLYKPILSPYTIRVVQGATSNPSQLVYSNLVDGIAAATAISIADPNTRLVTVQVESGFYQEDVIFNEGSVFLNFTQSGMWVPSETTNPCLTVNGGFLLTEGLMYLDLLSLVTGTGLGNKPSFIQINGGTMLMTNSKFICSLSSGTNVINFSSGTGGFGFTILDSEFFITSVNTGFCVDTDYWGLLGVLIENCSFNGMTTDTDTAAIKIINEPSNQQSQPIIPTGLGIVNCALTSNCQIVGGGGAIKIVRTPINQSQLVNSTATVDQSYTYGDGEFFESSDRKSVV